MLQLIDGKIFLLIHEKSIIFMYQTRFEVYFFIHFVFIIYQKHSVSI